MEGGATLGQRWIQGSFGSPDPWERHIFLDKCSIGETKESIGIYSKSTYG
jgi:hypothetical protein